MDGNRRYAKRKRFSETEIGHRHGFKTLKESMKWSFHLGVRILTVYAFSLENFISRSESEVVYLFQLAKEKLLYLIEKDQFVKHHNVQIRILGAKRLLGQPFGQSTQAQKVGNELLTVIDRVENLTKSHSRAILQICLGFTSSYNIGQARLYPDWESHLWGGGPKSHYSSNHLSFKENHFYSFPEILIRSSGETRLSDFMLYYCSPPPPYNSQTKFEFLSVLWPEFSPWDLFMVILRYQYENSVKIQGSKKNKKLDFQINSSNHLNLGNSQSSVEKLVIPKSL